MGEDGKPKQVRITTGPGDGSFVSVTNGLKEGDEVITGIVGQVQNKQQNGQNNFKGRGGFF